MPGMTKPWDPSLVRKTERQRLMEREVKGGGGETLQFVLRPRFTVFFKGKKDWMAERLV